MEIRRSYDRLISTMGFPILANDIFVLNQGPELSVVNEDIYIVIPGVWLSPQWWPGD